jgi:PAS domain S-box-containing protein
VAVLGAFEAAGNPVPNPAVITMMTVVLSGFLGGIGPALVSALFGLAHAAWFFSTPGQFLSFTPINIYRISVLTVVFPATAILVGLLQQVARRSAEQDRANAAFMTILLDQAQIAMALLGTDRRLVRVNGACCTLFGRTEADLLGRDMLELSLDGVADGAADRMTESKAEEWRDFLSGNLRQAPIEGFIRRKDGTLRTVLAAASQVADPQGRLFRLMTLTDISEASRLTSELLRAKEDAEAANHAKGAFLAGLSHELRTPLNAVIGFADLIAKETQGPVGIPLYRDFALNIRDSGQHLLELINEILDHARAEAGQLTVQEDSLDLEAAVTFAVRMLTPRSARAGVRLSSSIEPAARFLNGDEKRIRQILLNLISNAVKYTPASGDVRLTVRLDQDGALLIEVADNGIGIPEEDVERVLQAYVRVQSPANHETEGTGLGLPLTRRLVELHGGTLSLCSALGKGTTVIVRLPAERVLRLDQSASEAADGDGSPLSVLLVEDDPLIRMAAAAMLADWGHRVSEAANANEALSVLQSGQPIDLLFSDIVMPPGMNGAELAKQAERMRPGIAVLLTSGFAGHAVGGDEVAGRGYEMLPKPYTPPELKARLDRVHARSETGSC